MFLAFGRCGSLTSLLVLSAISTLVRSQAPGDASTQTCTKAAVPAGVFRLLDSYWYRTLLSGQSSTAGWTQTPANSWIGKGSFCTRRIENSCTSSTDNWLVTQYISKSADVSYELEITVDITGDADSTNAIKVYYYPSDGAITSGEQLNANNYNLIGSPSFGAATQKKSLTFSLGGQYDRFYIAIVEDNSCFTLRRLQVSYAVCPTETDGLVIYPNTPIGASAVTTSASCKANAAVSPGSSLSITCDTDGTFSGSPSCCCQGGYFESGESCFACAAGFFSKRCGSCTACWANSTSMAAAATCDCDANYYLASPRNCVPCPSQATSQPGADVCTCVSGYFRASEDGPSGPCTTGPDAPSGLTITSRTETTVSLSWEEPASNGGRTDGVEYTIRFKTLGMDFQDYNPPSIITSTSADVSGLSPVTTYTFVVVADNKVTKEFPDEFPPAPRTSAELTVMTKSSYFTSPPTSIKVSGPFVAWNVPSSVDGDVVLYQLRVGTGTGGYSVVDVSANTTYYLLSRAKHPSVLQRNTAVTVQIRAKTDQGFGEWSSEVFVPVTALLAADFIPVLTNPDPPRISLIGNSPIISGRSATFHLSTNHDVSALECRLAAPSHVLMDHDKRIFRDCSSGTITYADLPDGTYTFYAQGTLSPGNEKILLERKFRPDNMVECFVHLINNGVTVSGNSAIVEFTYYADFTRCQLDHNEFRDCSSPYLLTDLSPGEHFLKITPQICTEPFRYPLKLNFETT